MAPLTLELTSCCLTLLKRKSRCFSPQNGGINRARASLQLGLGIFGPATGASPVQCEVSEEVVTQLGHTAQGGQSATETKLPTTIAQDIRTHTIGSDKNYML